MSRSNLRNISCAVLLSAMMLTGCDVSTPSQFHLGKIQLKEGAKTATLNAVNPDPRDLDTIAAQYSRNHQGQLNLTLGYMQNRPQEEIAVRHQGDLLKKYFAERKIVDVAVHYVPIDDATYLGKAIVHYTALNAAADDACTTLPGSTGGAALADMDRYKIGCETQGAISQMIVDPADLMGRAGVPDGDSRRQGAAVEKYKSGTPNQKLDSINASSVGTSSGGG